MLRRKLLLILGPLVGLLVLTAVVAVALLQGVLRDLNHIDTHGWAAVEKVNGLSITINAIEVHLYELQVGKERHLDKLIEQVQSLRGAVAELEDHYIVRQGEAEAPFRRIRQQLPVFERQLGSLATAQDPALVREYTDQALGTAVALRQDTLPLSRHIRGHAQHEQDDLCAFFRWLVLGLSIVFLLVINVSVLVLMRAAGMVLRPVETLVTATRELGQERFDYRVKLEQEDEFGQLARAYNSLAEQLQANEKRKLEALGQAALALNHELNNAIATIELQLALLGRQANDRAMLETRLRQIRQNLERMARTVEMLKNVRRVVLTDYIAGVKMLDLERSAQVEEPITQ